MEIVIALDQIGVGTDGIDISIDGSNVYYDGYITVDSDDIELPEKPWRMKDVPFGDMMEEIVRRGDGLEHLIKHYFLAETRANR